MSKEKKLRDVSSGELASVRIEPHEHGHRVLADNPSVEATVATDERGPWSILTRRGSFEARVRKIDGEVEVEILGERFRFAVGAEAVEVAGRSGSGRSEVKAPMPGKVMKILVGARDTVKSGDGVLLFEAMKMQNEIRSPQDGILTEISVEEGQAVDARERLFVVESEK